MKMEMLPERIWVNAASDKKVWNSVQTSKKELSYTLTDVQTQKRLSTDAFVRYKIEEMLRLLLQESNRAIEASQNDPLFKLHSHEPMRHAISIADIILGLYSKESK